MVSVLACVSPVDEATRTVCLPGLATRTFQVSVGSLTPAGTLWVRAPTNVYQAGGQVQRECLPRDRLGDLGQHVELTARLE